MFDNWSAPQKILVILAHPDDPEFFCGGTIALWCSQGHKVEYCLFTRGDKGSSDIKEDPGILAANREKEQIEAARVLGVSSVSFLDHKDGYLVPTLEIRKEIVRVIRKTKPDILVGCDPTNLFARENYLNHPDHRAAGQIVVDAVFPAAGNPMFFPELINEENLPPHSVKEVWLSIPSQSNCTVDITPVWKVKLNALHKHKSQIGDEQKFDERMMSRRTADSTDDNPRFEEKFHRLTFS